MSRALFPVSTSRPRQRSWPCRWIAALISQRAFIGAGIGKQGILLLPAFPAQPACAMSADQFCRTSSSARHTDAATPVRRSLRTLLLGMTYFSTAILLLALHVLSAASLTGAAHLSAPTGFEVFVAFRLHLHDPVDRVHQAVHRTSLTNAIPALLTEGNL